MYDKPDDGGPIRCVARAIEMIVVGVLIAGSGASTIAGLIRLIR